MSACGTWLLGLLLVIAEVVLAPANAASQGHPALDQLGGYAIFARRDIEWHGASSFPAGFNIGSNDGVLRFLGTVQATAASSAVAAPAVELSGNTSISKLYATQVTADPSAVIEEYHSGQTFPLIAAPNLPTFPDITCGGESVTVGAGMSPFQLPPGRYDTITVTRDQRLELTAGGTYELCRMNLNRGSSILVHGSNTILIRDFLSSETRVRFDGPTACGARWIALGTVNSGTPNSAAFDFGDGNGASNRALIAGQFLTPARIAMEQHNDYVGRFWADSILAGPEDVISRTVAACAAPYCGDGNLDPGEQCDDGNNDEADCCTALCRVASPGASCDDGLYCTLNDSCDAAGICRGGDSPCRGADADANCSESCDEATRSCTAPDPYDSACNDGLFCNGAADRCREGVCVGTLTSPCVGEDGDGDCSESCDEATDSCNAADPLGSDCDDGLFCTVNDQCREGSVCAGAGSPCPAPDGDSNCSESCDEASQLCTAPDPKGSPCNDGKFCTALDTCDSLGACKGTGDPCPGADGDNDCSEGCNETTKSCDAADPSGTTCEDGSPCTRQDVCDSGTCLSGEALGCNDGNPCTDDFCDPDGGCMSVFNQAPCDDGNACTTVDRCELGVCTGTEPMDCSDGDLCNVDTCDPRDGSCRSAMIPASDCNEDGDGRTLMSLPFLPAAEMPGDGLRFAWRGSRDGIPSLREQMADPTAGGAWSVCVFDSKSGNSELRFRLDLDQSTTSEDTWKSRETKNKLSIKMKDPTGNEQGVSAVKMVLDRHDRAIFKLSAGANVGCRPECRMKFSPPEPIDSERLFAMEPRTIVQWKSSSGACWSTSYEEAKENSPLAFSARRRLQR